MVSKKRQLGDRGEALAASFLERNGYTIVDTNWHCQYGEIDIVARQSNMWVFVEVKTRRAASTESAYAGVSPTKQSRLVNSVHTYLSEHELDEVLWRVDVIAVALPHNRQPVLEHVEDALDW